MGLVEKSEQASPEGGQIDKNKMRQDLKELSETKQMKRIAENIKNTRMKS